MMVTGGSALVLLLACLFSASCAQQLPAMPQSFSVMVESNYLAGEAVNSTTYSYGYYDYAHNRFRIEEHTQNSVIVYIVLPAQNQLTYTLVVGTTNCSTQYNSSGVSIIAGEFFFFAQNTSVLNYTYVGNGNARGIITDAWNASYYGPDPTFAGNIVNFTIMYQFSVANWKIQAGSSSDYRVPVKATMEGYSLGPNNTQILLSRQYNFMDFFYGTFDNTLFAQPYACIPQPTSYSKSQAFTAGGIAGVVVAGVIILAAVVGRVIYLRRNPMSRGHRLADDAVM